MILDLKWATRATTKHMYAICNFKMGCWDDHKKQAEDSSPTSIDQIREKISESCLLLTELKYYESHHITIYYL
jgi:hypothetical protein